VEEQNRGTSKKEAIRSTAKVFYRWARRGGRPCPRGAEARTKVVVLAKCWDQSCA